MAYGITEAFIEELKTRIDIADLISNYGVSLHRRGATVMACCPFHHEKTPSFNINTAKGFYHCFGCGEHGDIIKFVEKMDGLSFVDAVEKLAGMCGMSIEKKMDKDAGKRKRLYALMAELAEFYNRCLEKTHESEIARRYLASRDLSQETQAQYLIGYAPRGCSTILKWGEKYKYTPEEIEEAGVIKAPVSEGDKGYHRFGGRLVFTIKDRSGRVVGFSGRQLIEDKKSGKYVNSPETLIFKKSKVLFGFDKAQGEIARSANREVIVCEGQIDCIRLHTSGFKNAVAGQGTAFTDDHVKMLRKVADLVTMVYDDDAAGHKATIKTARLCLAAGLAVRVVTLPQGHDPDSFLRTHRIEEFKSLLDGASSIMAFQYRVEKAKESNPDTVDAMRRITIAMLETVSVVDGAVLKAAMVQEAAKILSLPARALMDDLEKLSAKVKVPKILDESFARTDVLPPITGSLAESVVPPSGREMALMELLMANEFDDDHKLLETVTEHLKGEVIENDFTRCFIDSWVKGCKTGNDEIVAFRGGLSQVESEWFDKVLLGSVKPLSSSLKPIEVLKDLVRNLWCDYLKRLRGSLSSGGDMESALKRMTIASDIKLLMQARWSIAKEIISKYK